MSGEAPYVLSVQTAAERGGGEYASVDLLEALARRGISVRLLTNLPDLTAGTRVPSEVIELGPKLSRRSLGAVAVAFLPALARLARRLRRERPDVLLVHYKKEQLMAALLPRALTGAVVWAEWGPLPAQLRRGLPRLLYAAAAARARAVVAVSHGTRRSLIAAGVPAGKVTVVPPVVDAEAIRFDAAARAGLRREWGAAERTFVIGCVSRLQRRKRVDVAIDALAWLPADVLLVVAGEGEEEPALRRRAERFGERVRFLATPRGHVAQMLSACDVQVLTPGPSEGTPRAVIFGLLTERPVVATSPAGLDDIIAPGRGAIVSPSDDPEALARCLEEYRSGPERRVAEGRAGRLDALRRYDPARSVAAFEKILRDAIGR